MPRPSSQELPPRWVEAGSDDAHGADSARARALLRRLPDPPPLEPLRRARLAGQIFSAGPGGRSRRGGLLASLLLTGTAVGATLGLLLLLPRGPVARTTPELSRPERREVLVVAPHLESMAPCSLPGPLPARALASTPPAPRVGLVIAAPEVASHVDRAGDVRTTDRHALSTARRSPPARSGRSTPAPPTDRTLRAEATLVSEAFLLVRRGQQLERARALLDRHRRDFPQGTLRDEAERARRKLDRAQGLTLDRIPKKVP